MRKRLLIIIYWVVLCVAPASAQVKATGIANFKHINTPSYISLKTNLLYDAVMIPNVGAEISVFDTYSVYADLMFADWDLPARHIYWDFYGAQFGARKYFGKLASERSFSGHHAGIYAQALAYDLQAGNIGQQTPNLNMAFGVEYGYSIPVSMNLNIDLEIGLGYMTGRYYEYVVEEEHYTWRGTIQRAWMGPTKASVSLVWLLRTFKNTRRR